LQSIANFVVSPVAEDPRDYAHASVAPRQGSSMARLFVHAAISRAKGALALYLVAVGEITRSTLCEAERRWLMIRSRGRGLRPRAVI